MNEANYWRQRYEMLMAAFTDVVKVAIDARPPLILADKESYEAGRIAEREACARIAETAPDFLQNSTFDGVAAAIRARGQE